MKLLFCMLSMFLIQQVMADCASPPTSVQEFEILECREISPSTDTTLNALAKRYSDTRNVLSQYRGVEIETGSQKIFVPEALKSDCSEINLVDSLALEVSHACCDGDPNPPCLLGYSEYVLSFR